MGRFDQVDSTLGELLACGQLVNNYGGWGWPPAVAAAKQHAAKAAHVGGKWCEVCDRSGLLLFVKLRRAHSELMSTKW